MTSVKPNRTVRRGRLFPEIQWSEERKAQWRAERATFRKRCKVIFDRLKPELIKTHYNWYMAVEPESGEHFIEQGFVMLAGPKCVAKNILMRSRTRISVSMKQEFVARYDRRNHLAIKTSYFLRFHLIADNGLELPVDALLDTGFSGWLAMDDSGFRRDLIGLMLDDKKQCEQLRGEFDFDIYAGKVQS